MLSHFKRQYLLLEVANTDVESRTDFLAFTRKVYLVRITALDRVAVPRCAARRHSQAMMRANCSNQLRFGHGRPLQLGVLIVKKFSMALVVVSFCLGTCLVSPVNAQAKPAAGSSNIAVIDISRIFKNHAGFKAQMEGMKKEVEAFEASLRNRGKQIEQLRSQLTQFKSGTENYKRVEEQMAKIAAEGQAQTQLKRKDFLEREAKIYYNTYMQVSKAVEQFAQRNSIKLVVRFNSEPIEGTDRNSVLEGVNRAVVYQQNLNITDFVLQMLNRNVARKPGAATAR